MSKLQVHSYQKEAESAKELTRLENRVKELIVNIKKEFKETDDKYKRRIEKVKKEFEEAIKARKEDLKQRFNVESINKRLVGYLEKLK